ncbi:hypothetical protein [Aquisphaera insulae]|uniref:hypothetical protein n=1 Tax=Aquisphaera insulae TaxID=2712864 RepID=UPI0013EDFF94|nr:hypothetical protein [Aquisphaera insulae]
MPKVFLFLTLALLYSATPAWSSVGSRCAGEHSGPSTRTTEEASSGMSSALDDEIEIPDEPEDDCPDDPGDAHDPGYRPLERIVLPAVTTHVPASVRWIIGPILLVEWADSPRFLSLCRLLF